MSRPLYFCCLLTFLTSFGLQNTVLIKDRVLAQPAPICNPSNPLDARLSTLLEQAGSALDNRDSETAIRSLQQALSIALQTQQSASRLDLIRTWLLWVRGDSTTQFQWLMQQADKTQTVQLKSLLDQLFQLTQRLTPSYSLNKTLALVAIARYYAVLNQPQSAIAVLDQARSAARFIQGAAVQSDALLNVAAEYTARSQFQTAQTILAQVDPAVQKIPSSQSIRVDLLQRLATLYAQAGNDTKAKGIAAQLPKNSEPNAIALRDIANVYSTTGKLDRAEQIIPTIATPAHKAIALSQLAAAYDLAKQPEKATQRFRQAVQLAKSPAGIGSRILTKDQVIKELITSYLKAGRRDEARQLAQTDLNFYRSEAFKAIVLADIEAKQRDRAKQFLTEQLSKIQSNSDGNYGFDVLQTAVDAQLFDWVLQEWTRISSINYGLQDQQVERIVKSYAQTGQFSQVLKWVEQLPIANRPVLQTKLRSTIALQAHRAGQTAWAKNLLQQTQQRINILQKASRERLEREGGDALEPLDIQYIGLSAIALSYAQIGEAETTRQLLEQVVKLNSSANDTGLGGRVDNPFNLFLEAKQAIGALQLAQGTENPQGREYRLQSVASLLLSQNRFDLAAPIVNQLTPAKRKTQLLLAIAQRYNELGQSNQALPILAQAFKLAQTIPGEESEFERFGTDGTTVIDMTDDRGSLIEAIAVQYAQLKQPNQALKVANTLQDKKTREQALQQVNCALKS